MKIEVLSNMHDDMVRKIRKDPTWAENLIACASSEIRMRNPMLISFGTRTAEGT
jgi:hypothetical protein